MRLFNRIKHFLAVAYSVASVTFKEWAAYRTHSMVTILVGPLYYTVQLFIWQAVYQNRQDLGGMSLSEMLGYYGAVALIGYLTMDFADWNLMMLIRTGKYLNFAIKPLNHRFFALSQKMGHRVLGFIYEFIPVLLILTLIFRINLMPKNLPLTILSVFFSFLIGFYINYSLGLLGFWFTQTNGVKGIYSLLTGAFSGALVPLSLYPEFLQRILIFLPFQYVSYVPAMVWTGRYTIAGEEISLYTVVFFQGMYVLAAYALSEVLSRLGHKRFTGVGA